MPQPSWVRWRIFALLFSVGFTAYLLRTNMSIAGPSIMKDFGMTEFQLGIVLAAFAWGYALFQVPGGVLGKRIGLRRALALLLVLWGAWSLLTAVAPHPASISLALSLIILAGIRFLMGVSQAPVFPIVSGLGISGWFPPSRWGLPSGLVSSGLTLGAAATGPLVAWLVVTVGWRLSFLYVAPVAFLLMAIWYWYARDYPSQHSGTNPAERELIREGRDEGAISGPQEGGWKRALLNRNVQLLSISYFCMNYVFFLFFNWFYYYLTEVRSFTPQEGGAFMGAQWVVGSIAATAGGFACDWLRRRLGADKGYRLLAILGLTLTAPLLVAGALSESPLWAVILLSLSFGATQLTESSYWASAISVSGGEAASATALMNSIGSIVGGIGALTVPLTASLFGWVGAMTTGAVFALIGALLWFWIRSDCSLGLAQE